MLKTKIILIWLFKLIYFPNTQANDFIKVYTVASEATDGYIRYLRSASYYGIEVITLGMNTTWHGGDMEGMGGGYKLNLLKEALQQEDDNSIILFTDSYDVVFTSGIDKIIKKFKKMEARILFSAEHSIWPNTSLQNNYPPSEGSKYLNSGMFMGYNSDLQALLDTPLGDTDDDQLYLTKLYLNENKRRDHSIKLDHRSEIFQNLYGAMDDVKLDFNPSTGEGYIRNVIFATTPSVIHGNGLSKIHLNSMGNYLAGTFINQVCKICDENRIAIKMDNPPMVLLAVFIEKPTPFFEDFLYRLKNIDYPKNFMHLYVHNNVPYHESLLNNYIKKFGKSYKSFKLILPSDKIDEKDARTLAIKRAINKVDYLFSIDSDTLIDDASILIDLISYNKNFIAPVLSRHNEMWSNFWGALGDSGFYARSNDYSDIINSNIKGMWNVPYISSCYLIKNIVFDKINFNHKNLDPDMAMCANLRKIGVFMHVVNTKKYGHLVKNDYFNTERKNPDLYMLETNQIDWEQRYIRPEYFELLKSNPKWEETCPDVFRVPIFTERFCDELVEIMENFGKWSDGSNKDSRLEGGYEAVPTRDIHMKQVGLDSMWLKFLALYVRPIQESIFIGYFHNPPRSLMNFMVRYKPNEQPSLRPHHDSSTYTINIAMNQYDVDFKGGGCRFLRYNCSVLNTDKGWMLIHPGRLTHFHEGLKTTEGTRYIMISFVDP